MVRDVHGKLDVLNTTGSCGAPNFRQAKGGYAVFGMGQPSLNGFRLLLQKLQREGHKECVFFCVREEPVLFLRVEGDFVAYTPRGKDSLHENLHGLRRGPRGEDLELTIRKEIHDFAQLSQGVYYVYDDVERLRDEPRAVRVQGEEDVQVTGEVYRRPVFLLPAYRYHRLPLPAHGAPLEEHFDAFIRFLRESPGLLLRDPSRPPPALLFSCQSGVGRTNLAMAMATLVLLHHRGATQKPDPQPPAKTSPRARFRVIQSFIEVVPKGQQMVEEVDSAIASCSEMHDMKEAVHEAKKKLEGIGEDRQSQGGSTKDHCLQRVQQSLERYFYLVAFNYYLHEQYPLGFALSFSRWMCRHPELYRLQADIGFPELAVPGDLLAKGARVLVADERFCPDVLSTCQGDERGQFPTGAQNAHLWDGAAQLQDPRERAAVPDWTRRGSTRASCGSTCGRRWCWRGTSRSTRSGSRGASTELVPVPASTPEQLEKLEAALKGDLLKSQQWLEVYLEAEKQMKMFKSCLTTQEIFNQHKSTCPGLTYRRIPIPDFCAPKEQDFDRLLEAMKTTLAEDSRAAFVFNCASGRGRTTTGHGHRRAGALALRWRPRGELRMRS
uniref:Paladin n=1 Tax=Anas platyrhynchos TaxID=8839 RepID=A0A8B9SPG9_ANAPL